MFNKPRRTVISNLYQFKKKGYCTDEVVILTDMQNQKLSQICTPSHDFGRYHMTINMDIPTILCHMTINMDIATIICPFNPYFLILFSLAYKRLIDYRKLLFPLFLDRLLNAESR